MAKRLFGTNGVRGIINEDMTSELGLRLGKAIGEFFGGSVAIASDTRVSGDMIKSAVSAGLMAVGCRVLDLGTIPTPAIQYFVKTHDHVSGGVMITASHNPPEFNGIKCIAADGTELHRSDEEQIEGKYEEDVPCKPWSEVGTRDEVLGAADSYVDAIVSLVDTEKIRSANLVAVLDCANGASYYTAPLLLSKLNVRAITINANPQGEFPGHPSEPTEENLATLIEITKYANANIGIAHDGDADRTVFITDQGQFVSGDKSLALMAEMAVSKKGGGKVVTPVSSSSMVEDVVVRAGGEVIYTAVGSPVVARKMIDTDAIFGGEENGGLIFPEQQYCRDGAMTAAKMLEYIAKNGSLQDGIDSLPAYFTDKRKLECPAEKREALMEHLKGINASRRTDSTDGLKIIYPDGWALLRPSGTEQIFRIYSEAKDAETAEKRGAYYEDIVKDFLKTRKT
ncbi:MAG: phosphoglucosamine mutase [Candidatus Methanomethylophilaceae archaeon]|nr:phosphoglucosamine mutase [Candidatus Methanomethylophilaceae archaeon]